MERRVEGKVHDPCKMVRLQLVGCYFYGSCFLFTWLRLCSIFFWNCFELFALRSFECVVTRAKDNTALGACCPCRAEAFHESRESTCLQSDTPTRANQVSCSCQRWLMSSATWSIRGQGRLWRILPRAAALQQIEACLRARGHGCRTS